MKIGMKPAILAFGAMMLLAGCAGDGATPDLIAVKNTVHMPPARFFNCPLAALPAKFNSDRDVASTLATTYGNNVTCHNNMNAIQQDLQNQAQVYK